MGVAVVSLALTACAVFRLFDALRALRLGSWRELGAGAALYLFFMAIILFLFRVRDWRRMAARLAPSLVLLTTACVVFACGKGLLPVRHLPPPPESSNISGLDIVEAARRQVGVTVKYDPSYEEIGYPGGDVPRARGVCSDVVIRALRDARNIDLQQLVHEDMSNHFLFYPSLTRWLMLGPDSNIDHRRVLNLERFFERKGWSFKVDRDAKSYRPGDLVTCLIGGDLPHIMIVSDRTSEDGTPLVIHNVGSGACEENSLFRFVITGHHRVPSGF